MQIVRLAAIVILGAVLLSCETTPSSDVGEIQTVLDSILASHAELIVDEDVEALLAHYTDDVVVRANHTEPLRGHDGVRAYVTQLFDAVDIRSLSYETEDLAVHGDSVWHIVTYQMTIQAPGQPDLRERGSAIALWTRDEDGIWRIKHDILNSSVPMGVGGETE